MCIDVFLDVFIILIPDYAWHSLMTSADVSNDVRFMRASGDRGATGIIDNYVLIGNLMSELRGKLINRIPGSCLLISSLSGSASRTRVESLGGASRFYTRSRSLA